MKVLLQTRVIKTSSCQQTLHRPDSVCTTATHWPVVTTLPCTYTSSVLDLWKRPWARGALCSRDRQPRDSKTPCASGSCRSVLCLSFHASSETVRERKWALPASLGCNQATGLHNRKQSRGFRQSGREKRRTLMGDRKSDCKKERGVARRGGSLLPWHQNIRLWHFRKLQNRSVSTPLHLKQTLYKYTADQYLWLIDRVIRWWDFWPPKLNISFQHTHKEALFMQFFFFTCYVFTAFSFDLSSNYLFFSSLVSLQATVRSAKTTSKAFFFFQEAADYLTSPETRLLVTGWTRLAVAGRLFLMFLLFYIKKHFIK